MENCDDTEGDLKIIMTVEEESDMETDVKSDAHINMNMKRIMDMDKE